MDAPDHALAAADATAELLVRALAAPISHRLLLLLLHGQNKAVWYVLCRQREEKGEPRETNHD